MTKKGFTLIELLAAIVILAIISVIAIPIVLDVISDTRKNSAEISIKNIDKAASLYFQKNYNNKNIIFECNKDKCKSGKNELELSGKSPESGRILIDKKGNITYEDIVLNGFNCYKEHDKFICDSKKTRKEYKESEIIINSKSEYSLFDYNIYGNSVQNEETLQYESVGDKSKNLFNEELLLTNSKVTKVDDGYRIAAYPAQWKSNSDLVAHLKSVLKPGVTYTLSRKYTKSGDTSSAGIIAIRSSSAYLVYLNYSLSATNTFSLTQEQIDSISQVWIYGHVANSFIYNYIQLEEGSIATEYEPYGKYKIPFRVLNGKNLLDNTNLLASDTKDRDFEVTETGIKQTKLSSSGYVPVILYDITDLIKPNETYYIHREIEKNFTATKSDWELISGSLKLVIDGTIVKNIYASDKNGDISYKMPEEFEKVEIKTYTVPGDTLIKEFDENETYYFEWKNLYVSTEPYTEYKSEYSEIVNIYLDEPLRKMEEKADYIDFKNGKVVRYIEEDNEGNLKVLSIPKEEKIELPEILLHKGINNIGIESNIKPSKVELEYYK